VRHASGDSSGVVASFAKAFGKALTTTGDVFSQAGRISKGSSDRLHANANAHEHTENENANSFHDIHRNSGGAASTHRRAAVSGSPHTSTSSTGGSNGSSIRNDGTGVSSRTTTNPCTTRLPPAACPAAVTRWTSQPAGCSSPSWTSNCARCCARGVAVASVDLPQWPVVRPDWASTVDQRVEADVDGSRSPPRTVPSDLSGARETGTVLPESGPRWPLAGPRMVASPSRSPTGRRSWCSRRMG